jgi:hypothetical protein
MRSSIEGREAPFDVAQDEPSGRELTRRMPPFIFRCPNTGFHVQGLAPNDEESEGVDDVFVGVTCLACGSVHFINPKTGKAAGERSE